MEKKKLILFTNDKVVKEVNKIELEKFFENILDIEAYSLDEPIDKNSINGDLVLTISPIDIYKIKEFLKEDIEILQGTRTILYKSYKKLMSIPKDTKAIVISANKTASFDLASFLLKIGIIHLDFYPAYEGIEEVPSADIAIVPLNLNTNIDIGDAKIINLNSRRITIETYRAIMLMLNIINDRLNEKLNKHSKDLVNIEKTDIPLSKICALENILNITINEIDDGVIITNKFNKIIYINNSLIKMIGLDKSAIEFSYLDENIIPIQIYNELIEENNIENKMIRLEKINKNFLFSKKSIKLSANSTGSIVVLKDVTKIEKLETQIRGTIAKKGYVSKYKFDDIKGHSIEICECIEKAKKIALIERTVLILGESGTGKEMFAQAIHNYSNRKAEPFVAINCAALSSELLESELFGYEEGSFTGAKKGGKKGLFELAHTGTLFLDEIGDISLDMQIKLLRVLQEMEIRRIGGDNIIPIDVRVITATNVDLDNLVKVGKFRLDLYYRLNVFTLIIPPLRKRKEDVPTIVEHIFDEIKLTYKEYKNKCIEPDLMDILKNYYWQGNIRELKNCIEYMYYMGGISLSIKDLPPNFTVSQDESKQICHDEILLGFNNDEKKVIAYILNILSNRCLGRRSILKLLHENGYIISEYKLRNSLKYLHENRYIEYEKGKQGAKITIEGIKLIKKWDDLE